MKKFFVTGKNKKKLEEIKNRFLKAGFEYSESPELVVVSGGDGSLLIAERKFPGIPKLLIRDSPTCQRCHDINTDGIIELMQDKNYAIKEIKKVKAIFNGRELLGLNDVIIRNKNPNTALRFWVEVNNEKINDFIGDGVVIATHYGSTGYFSSITKKSFDRGFGVAFNNITNKFGHVVLENNEKVKIKITRGPGILAVDNSNEFIDLHEDDEIEVFESNDKARIVVL